MDDIPTYAGVILVTPDNRIILQLRDNKANIADPNCLSLFAGSLQDTESPEEGARRELFEETTLRPDKLEFFTTYKTDIARYGKLAQSHIFIARDIDPTTITVCEGQGYRIISDPSDLEKYDFALISKEILKQYFAAQAVTH